MPQSPSGQRIAVQCKHWQRWKVGGKTVREFLGALTAEAIPTGVLVTVRGFSHDARRFASAQGIKLVDETGLTALLALVSLRADRDFFRLLNDQRKFCPKCESEMVLRTSKKGSNVGGQFWGCSGFPTCKFTFSVE